ncbi:ABC transporter permease [Yinghuangia seranimata]|uniref:ABC transporter permease n=1 Tax=Yinghuangia seranimata TaxID=408067 RepID=UPI00248CDFE9|nr:ABC transporter permease [Yinghuangia seranimata]MDI2132018.1 FtsX-like permease family protein [Yinghuangia seranimata]
MWKTTLRNLVAYRLRLALTAVAIVFGVAFVSGVLTLSSTLSKAYKDAAATDYEGVSVAVRPTGDAKKANQIPALDEALTAKLRALPGVASVRATSSGFTAVVDRDGERLGGRRNVVGATFSPGKDGQDPKYRFETGRGPANAQEVAIDKRVAEDGGYKVGDRIRVVANGPVRDVLLVGTFTTDDAQYKLGGSITLFDRATAQQLFNQPGRDGELSVRTLPGTGEEALLAEVRPLVPRGAEAVTGTKLRDDQAKDIERDTKSLSMTLLAFAGIALFVGTFIIANTFTMLVAQRTREFALLRAVGATRTQVTRSVLVEATLLGVLSGTAGFVLGLGLCQGLRAVFNAAGAELPSGPLVITPNAVIASLVVGVLVTVVAAWLPARRAASIPPVAALRSDVPPTAKSLRRRNLSGAFMVGLGAVICYGYGQLKDKTSGDVLMILLGGAVALTGVIMLVPMLATPVVRAVGLPLARGFGISGKLARENAVRNPRRTAATASALMIGLVLVSMLSVFGASLKQELDRVALRGITADYGVSLVSNQPMDPAMVDAVLKAPGVQAASPLLSTEVAMGTGGTTTEVTGVDGRTGMQLLHADFTEGGPEGFAAGILLDQKFAKDHGWKVGGTVPVTYPDGQTASVTVAGLYETSLLLGNALMPNQLLQPHLDRATATDVLVKSAPGAGGSMRDNLKNALNRNPAVKIMSKDDYRKELGGIIDLMLNLLYALLGMAIVIAVIGIVNTLAMSVFERTREIGMLRAIGMDRRRIRSMIRIEAVMISVFGALLGTGIGLGVGVLGVKALKGSTQMTPTVPWERMGLFLVLAALVGMLAAAWPARRAARMEVLGAIKAE